MSAPDKTLQPIQLMLKQVLNDAEKCFPEFSTLTQLQNYWEVLHQVTLHSISKDVRDATFDKMAVLNTLIQIHTIRAN